MTLERLDRCSRVIGKKGLTPAQKQTISISHNTEYKGTLCEFQHFYIKIIITVYMQVLTFLTIHGTVLTQWLHVVFDNDYSMIVIIGCTVMLIDV